MIVRTYKNASFVYSNKGQAIFDTPHLYKSISRWKQWLLTAWGPQGIQPSVAQASSIHHDHLKLQGHTTFPALSSVFLLAGDREIQMLSNRWCQVISGEEQPSPDSFFGFQVQYVLPVRLKKPILYRAGMIFRVQPVLHDLLVGSLTHGNTENFH